MIRRTNEIFGYAFYVLGISKVLLVFLVLLKAFTNISVILNGGEVNNEYFPTLTNVVSYLELVLLIGSIVMIIINIKKQPETIKGYLWGLGAISLEFILPSIMMIFALFAQCSMFIKAGNKIRKGSFNYNQENKTTKKMIKNTDWFYSNENQQDEKTKIKQEKKKAKIQEEIEGWKQLFNDGQIDEETFNQEINRLKEKEKRINK